MPCVTLWVRIIWHCSSMIKNNIWDNRKRIKMCVGDINLVDWTLYNENYLPDFLAGPSDICVRWSIKVIDRFEAEWLLVSVRPPLDGWRIIDKYRIALDLWAWFKLWAGICAGHIALSETISSRVTWLTLHPVNLWVA